MLLPNRLFFEQVEQVLTEGEDVRIRMKGHSMRPLLRQERDTVVLRRCDVRRLRPGDVVLFRYRGQHILHRILRRDGAHFLLAGAGNYRLREQCTSDDIVARMVCVVRPSGRIVDCASRRWRIQSRLWLAVPEWVRRQLLRIMWHLRISR